VCKPETKCEKTVDPESKYRSGGVKYRVDGNQLELDWQASLFMNLTAQTNYCLEMRVSGEPLDNQGATTTIIRLTVTPQKLPKLMWIPATTNPVNFIALPQSPGSVLTMRGLWLGRSGADPASTEILLMQGYKNTSFADTAAVRRSPAVNPTTSWVDVPGGPGSLFSVWRFGSDMQVKSPHALLLDGAISQYSAIYGDLKNPEPMPPTQLRGKVDVAVTAMAIAMQPIMSALGILAQTDMGLKSYVSTGPNNQMEKPVVMVPTGLAKLVRMTSYADKPDGTGTVGVLGLTAAGEPALFAWNGIEFSYDRRSEAISKPAQVGTDPTDALAVGDVDGNGYNDIILARGGKVKFFLQNSGGSFVANEAELTPPSGVTIGALAVGQLDGQGKLDLAIADAAAQNCSGSACNQVYIYQNQTP
jgi:hypothetical protein